MLNKFKKWEVIGFIVTTGLGVLLHFTYELSGKNFFVGLFSPVSESTCEHLKMLYVPYVSYAIVEFFAFRKEWKPFCLGKFLGLGSGLLFIPLTFYGYLALLGHDVLFLDIAIFVLSVALSYFISYLTMKHFPKECTLVR